MKKLIAIAIALTSFESLGNDRFEDIRKPWKQCQACHGSEGQGAIGPRLAGQSADDIINKLLTYKRGEPIGAQSPMMYPISASLNEGQIGTFGVFVQEGFPDQ